MVNEVEVAIDIDKDKNNNGMFVQFEEYLMKSQIVSVDSSVSQLQTAETSECELLAGSFY